MWSVLNLNHAKLEFGEQKQENQTTSETAETANFANFLTTINDIQEMDNLEPIFADNYQNNENSVQQENQNKPEVLAVLLDAPNLSALNNVKNAGNLDWQTAEKENLTTENSANLVPNLNLSAEDNQNLNFSPNEQKQELDLNLLPQITPDASLNIAKPAESSGFDHNLQLASIAATAPTPQIMPANLGQKIINLISKQEDNAYLELSPANLGKLGIKLNVQQNQLQIALNCDNSLVKNFLVGQITNLQQVLAPSFGQINVQIESNLPQNLANQQQNQSSNLFQPPFITKDKNPVNENLAPILTSQGLISYYV